MLTRCLLTMATAAGIFASAASGQENTSTNARVRLYDVKRETTLIGTVQTYTAAAQTAPLGAHVTLQTSGGVVDVHLGDARLLTANHFAIQSGDTLRIIGEGMAYGNGTQFVARIVQKDTQALAVRSVRGIPLSYMAPREAAQAKAHGGAL
ncbi:MAG: hypothetical protein WBL63_25665 [Candidatus Acidiferrum sp.]